MRNQYEKQEKVIRYERSELADLDMAYALTTHKMQGSSRKTVICVIDNTHYKLLDNCMLYTQYHFISDFDYFSDIRSLLL